MCTCRTKLVSVPELDYHAENGEGEICLKGPTIFKGYLRNQERTRKVLDADGWLHSGDIGHWNSNGTLTIIDRKRHMIKMSQGVCIAPQALETMYQCAQYVAQIFVHGDSQLTKLVAIVVPDEVVAGRWARKRKLDTGLAVLCQNELFKVEVLKELHLLGTENGVQDFELVSAVYLHPVAFSVDDNLVTETMKQKRKYIQLFFEREIEAMCKLQKMAEFSAMK